MLIMGLQNGLGRADSMMTKLIPVLAVLFLLVGCAKPVVDYAEPGTGQHYVARKDLKDIKLPPAPTTKEWLDGAALHRVREPVRRSVHQLCLQLKMKVESCNKILSTKVEYQAGDPAINAFADGMNNRVIVLGGLIKELATDAEVAAIMAHEMAHIVFQHHRKMHWNRSLGGIVGVGLATIYAGVTGVIDTEWVSQGAKVGRRVYSPEMEIEADRMAVYVMHDLSYPPTAVRDLIVRFYRTSRDKDRKDFKKPGRWQTHPSDDRRYAHIMQAITDVEAGVPITESGVCRECKKQ